MIFRHRLICGVVSVIFACGVGFQPNGAEASINISFELQLASVTSTSADFDVWLAFASTTPGDRLEAVQLSVIGSDPLLTSGDSDYSLFSFALNNSTAPLDAWLQTGTIDLGGVELLFPFDPFLGPFINSGDSLNLGQLTVDVSSFGGQTLMVTIAANPLPGLETDAGGILNGGPVFSARNELIDAVNFANPDGVMFEVPGGGVVPEPTTAIVWTTLAGFGVFIKRRRR